MEKMKKADDSEDSDGDKSAETEADSSAAAETKVKAKFVEVSTDPTPQPGKDSAPEVADFEFTDHLRKDMSKNYDCTDI